MGQGSCGAVMELSSSYFSSILKVYVRAEFHRVCLKRRVCACAGKVVVSGMITEVKGSLFGAEILWVISLQQHLSSSLAAKVIVAAFVF